MKLDFITSATTLDEKNARLRGTLVLLSTLSSVAVNGIWRCNLFNVIIYCGSHYLSKSCELEYGVSVEIDVKVTNQYPANTDIFGRSPALRKNVKVCNQNQRNYCSPTNNVVSLVVLPCILLSSSSL